MGGIGIISVFFSILFFNLVLYMLTLLYSFFFSKYGKQRFYRDFYECGFKSISDNKVPLDIHFSIIGIIFLIYEMEIILFVPILLNLYNLPVSLLFILISSLLIIALSYWYEWDRFGLSWIF